MGEDRENSYGPPISWDVPTRGAQAVRGVSAALAPLRGVGVDRPWPGPPVAKAGHRALTT
jgi:hypothetical protein